MKKLTLLGLFVLVLCFTASCGKNDKETAKDKPGTVYVLNEFEDNRDLFSIRPAVQYMSASMDIVGKDAGQVKAGEGSMKYTYERGNWPDMVLHIKESDYPELDIANLNKMNLSVYNENEKAVSGVVSVVVGGNKTLLTQDITLEPGQWNDLEFRLSALACEYNADQILGFRFRMEAEENSVFYMDEWSVTMGAENTEEDNKWEPVLLEIIDRIDKLPKEISMQDAESLEELYMDYAELPDLYRNIVPNYSSLYATLEQFVEVKFASEEDALERKLLAFDEFYGIGQIDSANYSMMYQTDVKFEDEKGSVMVTFDGATKESYFPYHSPLDPKRYDYVKISFFNADDYRKVIYFNWTQRIVVEPQTWGTLKIPGDELLKEGNIIVDTIDAQGTRINSSGTVYMGAMHAYRRDLLAEMKKLPDAASFQMRRDIKYLTLIERTMELYEKTPDTEKVNIPKYLVTNLENCYKKIAGYGTVLDAMQEDIEFGTPDCAAVGEVTPADDETYGPVWELNFTAKAKGAYAAGFRFVKEMEKCKNMFFYIYNPMSTEQTMELYSDGTWNDLGMRTLEPGWNEIEIPADVETNHYIFGLFAKTQNVVGTWKVSSLYEVSDDIVNREAAAEVSALIRALPNPKNIVMPRDLKYVADIWEAYDAYEALSPAGKRMVSGKSKLDACMKAIKGYKASINAKTDEMMVGTPDCVCSGTVNRKTDKTYGPVFALNITKSAKGDYAAGFQVNKDISADKNLFFYMYNPKKSAQTMYLYANPSWDSMGEHVLNPGWNLIELPKDAKIDKYLFGLFPEHADVKGEWKITSVYSKSADLVNTELASEVKEMIQNLPDPSTIEMPRDLKYVTAISAAKESYDALSAQAKKKISNQEKAELNACVSAIEGYTTAVNAITDDMTVGTPDAPCEGVIDRKEDADYGTVFALDITKAGTGEYVGGFQVNKDISAYKNLFFYVYNPQDAAQNLYLYADPSWKDLGARTLNPGWNKIELSNSITIERYIFGIFPKGTDAVGEWKISSIYAMTDAAVDKEESKTVAALIDALPDASTIQMPDDIRYAASIYQAKESYDALSSAAKQYVSDEQLAKLQDCLAAIDGYKVVVNALTDEMSVGTADAPCQGVLSRADDAQAGPVFGLNITEAGTGAYAGGFQVNKDLSAGTNLTFSIYNPFDSNRTMWLYADPSWKDLGAQDLVPGWNKIEIPNNVTVEKYVFGLFPGGTDIVGEWKITSFYALSDEALVAQEAKVAELVIQALKDAAELTIDDKAAVDAAKAAYDALSDEAKALVPQASKDKLDACVAKIKELEEAELPLAERLASKLVVDASATHMTVFNSSNADLTASATVGTHALLTNVMQMPADGATLILEPSRQTAGYKAAEKVSYWIYNPTDDDRVGYYTVDWVKNVNFTLAKKSWTRIDIDNTSVDSYLTSGKTIYFYINGGAVGEDWLVSGLYADLTATEIAETETELAKAPTEPTEPEKSLAEKLAAKLAVDASATHMTVFNSSNADITASATVGTHALLANVMQMPADGATLILEPSRQTAEYKAAEKVSYWIYNATDEDRVGYYTMDWVKNVNYTLAKKSWTRIDIDNTSVDSYLTSGKTIYFYINGGVVGEGWLVSGLYADLTVAEIEETETELAKVPTEPEESLAEKLAAKLAVNASATHMTVFNSSNADITASATVGTHALLANVMQMPADGATLILEPSRQTAEYKAAEKVSYWIYNPTDSDRGGYYTADWVKNVNFTLAKKSWTRIDIDNASVDSYLTSGKTIYFYINGGAVGEGWLVSGMYADLTTVEITEAETALSASVTMSASYLTTDSKIKTLVQ